MIRQEVERLKATAIINRALEKGVITEKQYHEFENHIALYGRILVKDDKLLKKLKGILK